MRSLSALHAPAASTTPCRHMCCIAMVFWNGAERLMLVGTNSWGCSHRCSSKSFFSSLRKEVDVGTLTPAIRQIVRRLA